MTKEFYSELNIFCILILLILIVRMVRNVDRQMTQRLLEFFMLSVIGLCASDMFWILSDHAFPVEWIAINYIVEIVYYLFTALVSFSWFFYSEYQQESILVKNKRRRWLSAAPMAVLCALVLTTPLTGLIFFIDSEGSYHRGPLIFLVQLLGIGYALFTSIKAFVRAQNKKNYANRNKLVTISSFGIYPAVFGIWQLYESDIPVLSMGLTIAVLQIYINLLHEQISIDPLTQLNNRNQLIRFLSGKMKSVSPSKTLYLLMMDMDYFKKINDQYGHIEGDRALVRVAGVLKRVCAKYNCFACRYGGDEFIIVGEMKDDMQVEQIRTELNEVLAEENKAAEASYLLHLSIGYAARTKDIQTIPDFIEAADSMLYEIKRAR